MKKLLFLLGLGLFAGASSILAQPRPIDKNQPAKTAPTATVAVVRSPATFAAKYEGGMFGFNKKEEGTFKFDDMNERIVFHGKDGKEKVAIPYASMLVVSAQSKSVRSATGTAISVIPLPGAGLAGLIREKRRYLAINFDDPDVDAKGIVNFKLANKELLASVIQTLGEKAKLIQRGDAYVRPRTAKADDN
jgi:hypothetical protein